MARIARNLPTPGRRRLRDSADAVALFGRELASRAEEALRVAHLDGDGWVLGVTAADGGRSEVDLPIARIVRDAIALGARGLVIAHNHPGGDPSPSRADKAATRRLADIARGLDIRLIDHLVFAGDRFMSFRLLGLL